MNPNSRPINFIAVCKQDCDDNGQCPHRLGILGTKPLKLTVTNVMFRGKQAFRIQTLGGYKPKYIQERYPNAHFELYAKMGRCKINGNIFEDTGMTDLYSELQAVELPNNNSVQVEAESMENEGLIVQSKKIKKKERQQEPKRPAKISFANFFPTPNVKTRRQMILPKPLFPANSRPLEAFKHIFEEISDIKLTCQDLKEENAKLKAAQLETEANVSKIGNIAMQTAKRLHDFEQTFPSSSLTLANDTLPIHMRIRKATPVVKNEFVNNTGRGTNLDQGHLNC